MQFFRNVVLNLKATGPSAVVIVWIIAVAGLGLYGEGERAHDALGILAFVGAMLFAGLGSKIR